MTSKFDELKRQGLFLRSSPSFSKTDYIGNTTTGAVTTNSSSVFAVLLRNPDTLTSFYIVRQNESTSKLVYDLATCVNRTERSSRDVVNFKINVMTSAGKLQLPQVVSSVTLGGRQSKVIVADYSFGSSKLLYSTAQILFAGQIGGRDVLFLYGDSSQEHEASLVLTGTLRAQTNKSHTSFTSSSANGTTISFLSGIQGLVTVYDSDTQLILYSDKDTAATFWAPVIPGKSGAMESAFTNYWQFGTNTSVLVGGPYLVRNASISGSKLALHGDLQMGVRLIVIAPENIRSITWNGDPVAADAALTKHNTFVGRVELKNPASSIVAPTLGNWKFADSLPEIQANFSDASWTIANHITTNIPYKPYYGDRVLYGCDYKLYVHRVTICVL